MYTGLTGVRIGVPRNGFSNELVYQNINDTIIMAQFEKALDALRELGAEIVDSANFTSVAVDTFLYGFATAKVTNETISCASGFNSGIPEYFGQLTYNPHNITSVEDLANFTKTDPREDYPDRNIVAWEGAIAIGYGADDERAIAVHQDCLDADEQGGVTGVIRDLNLDALIIPTDYSPTWASTPGLPGISVPLGVYPADTPVIAGRRELVDVAPGIPYGVSFLGQRWSEEKLIGIAHVFEQATLYRNQIVLDSNAIIPSLEIQDVLSPSNTTYTYTVPSATASATATPTESTIYPTIAPAAGISIRVNVLTMALSMVLAAIAYY